MQTNLRLRWYALIYLLFRNAPSDISHRETVTVQIRAASMSTNSGDKTIQMQRMLGQTRNSRISSWITRTVMLYHLNQNS